MAFAQPSAGSGLVTSSLTSGILLARNNADTTATTFYGSASGTVSRSLPSGHAITYDTALGDGRYMVNTLAATKGEQLTGVNWGTEFTFICVVKRRAGGGDPQRLLSENNNPPRVALWINTDGTVDARTYDSGSGGSRNAVSAAITDNTLNVVGIRYNATTQRTTVGLNGTRTDSAGTGPWTSIGSGDAWQNLGWDAAGQCSQSPEYAWVLWNRALSDGEFDSAMATLADNCSDIFDVAAPAPVLSSPTGTATGPTQATIGLTTDTAPGTTTISYQILAAATAAPSAATIVASPTGTITTGSVGALTKAVTTLTTNTAVKVHFAQGATSNVVSSASFTPNTLAIAGTALSAQTGTAGSAFTWSGSTPESLITNTGNGSGSWTATAGVGASGCTVNSSTGILVATTLGTAGSYTITLQRTDGSTVPSAQTVTKSVGLTISASGAATAVTMSGPSSGVVSVASTNFTVGANGTITGTVVVTPSDSSGGGTFSPTSVSISSGSPTGTFTYTPGSTGSKTISVTNNGSLSNPSNIPYTVSSASRTVAFALTTNGTSPAADLSGLKWAFFDEVTPNLFNAPTAQGTGASTDSSGTISITITGTSLTAGQIGWLILTDSNGTITQNPPAKAFSGPVVIS